VSIAKWFSRQALLRLAGVAAAALALSPVAVAGQVVRGVVVDEASGRPLPGTVVVLLDSARKRVAGVLVDDNGRFAIRTTVPGRYGVRAERIGFRADTATPVTLGVGQTVELRLATRPIPVVLGAVRVVGKSACVTGAADGREVSAVWEETRKALYATDLAERQELFSARVSHYERTLDAETGRVTSYRTTQVNAVTRSPFVSLPAAQLSADGYVRQNSTETIYYGPDASVLLSDEFLRDHCFRLRDGEGKRGGLIGLVFEPARGRERPDIVGTLWIDRKTAELRDLEYSYWHLPNLPSSTKSEQFGGHVEFQRMPTGAWIVDRWVIRMPMLRDRGAFAQREAAVIPGSPLARAERIQLVGIHEEGGEVLESIARGERRESKTDVASVRGIVFDSTRMQALGGARVFLDGTQFSTRSAADGAFAIGEVPPGTYAISVVHPRFDSLDVRAPAATLELRANQETVAQLAGPSAATILAKICAVEERTAGPATLRGRVRDGESGEPAVEATVALTWNALQTSGGRSVGVSEKKVATRTDSSGRYDFCGLPEGVRITARATVDDRRSAPAQLLLSDTEMSVVDFIVGKSTAVAASEPARVAAPIAPGSLPRNRAMQDFERRRRRGNGAFLTRAQIDRLHAPRLTDLLRTMPGVTVEPNESGALVVELRRAKSFTFEPTTAARNDSGAPSPSPVPQVSVKKCPANFTVDGLPIDGGATVDLDVRPEMVEAIEVYSAGQVPIEFSARNAECGVVMIWTRAFSGRADTSPGADANR
jgi:hypothetical protein